MHQCRVSSSNNSNNSNSGNNRKTRKKNNKKKNKNKDTDNINLEYSDMPVGDVSFESRGIIDMDLGGASVGAYAGVNDEDSNEHDTTVT